MQPFQHACIQHPSSAVTLLWGAWSPSLTPPSGWASGLRQVVRSDSFQVRLILHGACLQAARTRSDVCVCPSSWGRLSSSHFPKSTTTPMGKWGTAAYLGKGGVVVHQPHDTLPQLPPGQDALVSLALKTLGELTLSALLSLPSER